jgi:phosphohistidine phosphatase SixA
MMGVTGVLLLFLLQGGEPAIRLPAPGVPGAEIRVFIVRHAEKDVTVRCPEGGSICMPLTAVGKTRAAELARLLKGQPLKRIFSTEYRRTQDTARPSDRDPSISFSVPAEKQLTVVDDILKGPGTYLVVTHSDMVIPFLRKLLSNDQVTITAGAMPKTSTVIEDPDYDNLFLVTMSPTGAERSCKLFYFGEKTAGDLAVKGCSTQGRLN